MSFKWIITDIDGCLSPEESEPWDLDLFWELARLCRAAADGKGPIPPMTLCTGRPQPYVEVLAKILDVRLPIIAENGAVLYSLHDNWSRFGPGVTAEKVHGLRVIREYLDDVLLPRFPARYTNSAKRRCSPCTRSSKACLPRWSRRFMRW